MKTEQVILFQEETKFQFSKYKIGRNLPLNNNTRLAELDSLRGLAALAVFFSHFTGAFMIQADWFQIVRMSPLGMFCDGAGAVTMFFLLSGFVLSLPFVNTKKSFDLIPFYIKRVFRIYPALLVAIVFALILQHFLFRPESMLHYSEWIKGFWNWDLHTINLKEIFNTAILIGPAFDDKMIVPVLWSLIIEMKISLILPFFIVIASKTNFSFNVLFLFSSIYFTGNSTLGIFYIGILLAKYKDVLIERIRTVESLWLTVLLFSVAILFYSSKNTLRLENTFLVSKWYISLLIDYLQAIGCAIIIILILAKEKVFNFLKKKSFLFLGEVSYSFYLLHFPILLVVCSFFSNAGTFSLFIILAISLSISLAISYLIFKGIEKPFQTLAKTMVEQLAIVNKVRF